MLAARNEMRNEFLYRFISPPGDVERYWERLRLLVQDSKVQLSRPSRLNDPFDCKTLFSVTDATTDDLWEFLESTIIKYGGPQARVLAEAAMRVAESDPDRAIEHLRRRYTEFHVAELDENGILCFFQSLRDEYPEDLLMWAHYADGHRGFCVQFRKRVLTESFICKRVQYMDRYPTLKEVAAHEGEGLAELFLFRKSTRWSYENEWRLLALFTQTDQGLLQLPSEALSGVIFGCESDPSDCERILQWAQHRQGPPLSFFRARKHSEKYRITIQRATEQPTKP